MKRLCQSYVSLVSTDRIMYGIEMDGCIKGRRSKRQDSIVTWTSGAKGQQNSRRTFRNIRSAHPPKGKNNYMKRNPTTRSTLLFASIETIGRKKHHVRTPLPDNARPLNKAVNPPPFPSNAIIPCHRRKTSSTRGKSLKQIMEEDVRARVGPVPWYVQRMNTNA